MATNCPLSSTLLPWTTYCPRKRKGNGLPWTTFCPRKRNGNMQYVWKVARGNGLPAAMEGSIDNVLSLQAP